MKLKHNSISIFKSDNISQKEIKSEKIKILLRNGLETGKSFFPSLSLVPKKKVNSVPTVKKSYNKDSKEDLTRKNRIKVQSDQVRHSHNSIALYKESNKLSPNEKPKSFSCKEKSSFSKVPSRTLDISSQTQCNFNNKLLQNYLSSKSKPITNDDNCVKIEKIIAKDSKNECKEVNQCETLKVTKSNIVFNYCKKREKDEQLNKIIINYLKKKVSSATLSATTFRMQKLNLNILNCLNDYTMNSEDQDDNNILRFSQPSSVYQTKNSENKLLIKDLKQTVPIFTKI